MPSVSGRDVEYVSARGLIFRSMICRVWKHQPRMQDGFHFCNSCGQALHWETKKSLGWVFYSD